MKPRRPRSSAIIPASVIGLLLISSASAQTRVRLGTLAPKGTTLHQILLEMGEQWRKAPSGGVALTVYPDGTMGGEADMVRRMRVGQLHAAMLTVAGLSDIDVAVTALQNMPMMFRSLDEVDYIGEELRPKLEQRLLEKGFVMLFWADVGWVRFFSRRPIERPADLKKLKLFVWAGDAHTVDLWKSGGYSPVPLETSDALAGLQTGLIDAMPNVPLVALAGQFYIPASHMLELNWAPLVGGTVISRKQWDTIPKDTQQALLAAAQHTGERMRATNRSESNQAVDTMKKRGLTVHPVTPDIEAEWRRAAEEVYPQIRGKLVPAEWFDEVQGLLKEYRASGAKPKS